MYQKYKKGKYKEIYLVREKNTPLSYSHEEKVVEVFTWMVLCHKLSVKTVMRMENICILQC